MLAQLQSEYPQEVRVVYRHFPLNNIHDKAALAAQASEAAGEQDEFWAMHDLLFEKQNEWSSMTVDQFQEYLVEQAGELGLDAEQFGADLTSEEIETRVQEAYEHGQDIGLPGTPLLLINGNYYGGPMDYWNMQAITKMTLLEDEQYTACPPVVIDAGKQYVATLETQKGDIVLELFPDVAPLAVNSFVFLAQEGWFDEVTFHRVLPGFVAQAGDPTGTGFGGPGYAFDNEISPDLKFDQAGMLGMANAGPGSNGSQFFITMGPTPNLDGGYTIFGQVISGQEVVESLTPRDPSQNANLPPGDKILDISIEER